jgi:hypothetical protein
LDRANCSADYELQDQFFSEKKEPDLTEDEQLNFKGYEFNVEVKGPLVLPNKKSQAAGSGGVMGEAGGRIGQLVVVNEREAKMPQHLQDAAQPKSDIADDSDPAVTESKEAKQNDFIAVHRDHTAVSPGNGNPLSPQPGSNGNGNLMNGSNGLRKDTSNSYAATVPPAADEPVFVISSNNNTSGNQSARKTLVDDRGSEKKSNSDNNASSAATTIVVGERKSVVARKSSASAELTANGGGPIVGASSDGRAELSGVRLGEGGIPSGAASPAH